MVVEEDVEDSLLALLVRLIASAECPLVFDEMEGLRDVISWISSSAFL